MMLLVVTLMMCLPGTWGCCSVPFSLAGRWGSKSKTHQLPLTNDSFANSSVMFVIKMNGSELFIITTTIHLYVPGVGGYVQGHDMKALCTWMLMVRTRIMQNSCKYRQCTGLSSINHDGCEFEDILLILLLKRIAEVFFPSNPFICPSIEWLDNFAINL